MQLKIMKHKCSIQSQLEDETKFYKRTFVPKDNKRRNKHNTHVIRIRIVSVNRPSGNEVK